MIFFSLSTAIPQEHWRIQRGCVLNLLSLCTLPLSLFHSLSVLLSLMCGQGVSKPLVLPRISSQAYLFMVSVSWQTQVVCMKLWCPLAPHTQCLHKNHQRLPNQKRWTKSTSSCALGSVPEKKKKTFLLGSNGLCLSYSFVMKFALAIRWERVQYQRKCSEEARTHKSHKDNRPYWHQTDHDLDS